MWKKFPRQMLAARASAELCRLIAPDAIQGLGLTVEEVEDEARPAPRARQATPEPETNGRQVIATKAVLKAAPDPVEPPSWDDNEPVQAELVEDDEPAIPQLIPTGDMATEKQVKMALALCSGAKLDDKARHDMVYGSSDGRTEHIRELTKAEISKLIDDLKAPAGEEPF
jgi:hypothetical protein